MFQRDTMAQARRDIVVNLVRIVAPAWLAAAAVFAAFAGVIVYFAVGALVSSFPLDLPDGIVMPLYILFIASPAFLAFFVLGRVSAALYRQDPFAVPALLLHLWHCALLYPLAGWTLFLLATCPGTAAPVPGQCADPFGTSMAAGAVALGGILADAFAAYRRRR
jgi:hypothetical protein